MRDREYTDEEVLRLIEGAGPMDGISFDELDMDDESMVEKYAEHIRNYEYTYKPEATEIDPSIDPDEQQVGPMAQDIEQVNPAAVKEVAGGVKTVDIGRLALMNAGVLADLCRKVTAIEDFLQYTFSEGEPYGKEQQG